MRRKVTPIALAVAWAMASLGFAGEHPVAPDPHAPAVILQDLARFREFGSVLYVAAHPDDENTQLITYLALGRNYRTAYLSLTRGDGGQNLLGPEFGPLLGVIRTQELLAARSVDGGRQYFSRARDFGYSKDYRQTLMKWDHQEVLSDIVRVIRQFRPDVVIVRFPPEPSPTHGHHTASAALALEAFRKAGDPQAFPEQLDALSPWQPKRIVWNRYGGNWSGPAEPDHGVIHIPIDGTDAVTGASFAVLAARSRSMHRTQGFANFSVASAGSGPRLEAFEVLGGSPEEKDLMDGVDTTWGRVKDGAEIERLTDAMISRFDPKDPSASVPALLDIKDRILALPIDPLVQEKALLLDRIIQACVGLTVNAQISVPEIIPGETVSLTMQAKVTSAIPVTWIGTQFMESQIGLGGELKLTPQVASVRQGSWVLSKQTLLSQPYWLRRGGSAGMFQVDDASLIGQPWNPPISVKDAFLIAGRVLVVPDDVVFVAKGAAPVRPEIVAPVSLNFTSSVQLFAPGSSRTVTVEITAARSHQEGSLRLEAPAGWNVEPAQQPFLLAAAGDKARFAFAVAASRAAATAEIAATAVIGGVSFDSERIAIRYSHIPPLLLQPRAQLKAVCLELSIRGHNVGYLPGAGDSTAEGLAQMGYAVTTLSGNDLTAEKLKKFDAVVVGVRAFNTRTDLAAGLPALFAFVASGGTLVEQYNTPGNLQTTELAPYALKLSRDLPKYRVTDEKSAVTFLEPEHPAFNVPNRITRADFDDWVQERGLDFASEWDSRHLVPLLACSDAGEPALAGGLVVARFGRGYFVYTGLSFFRQLPAGVPGAYRLLANLVSLGK